MADAHGVDIAIDGGSAGYCSSAAKSKRLAAAAVQSDSLRPFLGGGGGGKHPIPVWQGRGCIVSKPIFSSCIHATPTQRAPQPLRPLTDYSVKVCFRCGEPEDFENFSPKGPQKS